MWWHTISELDDEFVAREKKLCDTLLGRALANPTSSFCPFVKFSELTEYSRGKAPQRAYAHLHSTLPPLHMCWEAAGHAIDSGIDLCITIYKRRSVYTADVGSIDYVAYSQFSCT